MVNESTIKMVIYSLLRMKFSAGFYSMRNNCVNLYGANVYEYDFSKTGPYHELFHMASANYDKEKNIAYHGLMQQNLTTGSIIGVSLNEGCTQLLAEKYFNPDKKNQKISFVYQLSRNICEILDQILDNGKLENLYMNANLSGLINELSALSDYNNSIQFIQDLDFIFKNYSQIPMIKQMYNTKIKSIQIYLINLYINEKVKDLNNNLIINQSLEEDVLNFYDLLCTKFIINNKNLNQITKEDVLEILKYFILEDNNINKQIN